MIPELTIIPVPGTGLNIVVGLEKVFAMSVHFITTF